MGWRLEVLEKERGEDVGYDRWHADRSIDMVVLEIDDLFDMLSMLVSVFVHPTPA